MSALLCSQLQKANRLSPKEARPFLCKTSLPPPDIEDRLNMKLADIIAQHHVTHFYPASSQRFSTAYTVL